MTGEFQEWPKIARLNRDCLITEKIDGTNGQILIEPAPEPQDNTVCAYAGSGSANNIHSLRAGSRNRWIRLGVDQDNAGFAGWVRAHAELLFELLGPGRHFGEWYGKGIGRAYGLAGKQFALFNVLRYRASLLADPRAGQVGLGVVPILYEGLFSTDAVKNAIARLRVEGSLAVPGFMRPEGVVVFHRHANVGFKVTLEKDELPKGATE